LVKTKQNNSIQNHCTHSCSTTGWATRPRRAWTRCRARRCRRRRRRACRRACRRRARRQRRRSGRGPRAPSPSRRRCRCGARCGPPALRACEGKRWRCENARGSSRKQKGAAKKARARSAVGSGDELSDWSVPCDSKLLPICEKRATAVKRQRQQQALAARANNNGGGRRAAGGGRKRKARAREVSPPRGHGLVCPVSGRITQHPPLTPGNGHAPPGAPSAARRGL
jgi:hypothetical protein